MTGAGYKVLSTICDQGTENLSSQLSNTVDAILKLLENVENKENSKEILETAHIVEDLDKLFDCTNGPGSRKDISFHHERWREYTKKKKTTLSKISKQT
ncbi:Signal transduction histidine kinase [Operophtera brumata]|uniref:Signal transduction histidine kinase n=1 Tax=Operophtera brumata TaxID=104452 RepID=A0A0L7K4N2_OPEBR|nr:Signal transduction histidine kinase [Operophtera brumata]